MIHVWVVIYDPWVFLKLMEVGGHVVCHNLGWFREFLCSMELGNTMNGRIQVPFTRV
jgi:hypothetical protein